MEQPTPCLWFDGHVDEALAFYADVFGDVEVESSSPGGADGGPLTVVVRIRGQRVMILNGGPHYRLTPAFSFLLTCEDQDEVDRLWDGLVGESGTHSQCGWLEDPFGVSWQVVPRQLFDYVGGPDADGAARAMQAMLAMTKLDVAALRAAYEGTA